MEPIPTGLAFPPRHSDTYPIRSSRPAGRGRLIDHPAPELTCLWSSDTALGTKLSDLKGKVVVLDFRAAWCGPCIGSFPNMRELVDRYRGYDVVLLGATGVQGTHYGVDGQVDCTDDPEKEFGLTNGFMAEKEMTWPVVFIEGDVFHPDYGVREVPEPVVAEPVTSDG